MKNQKRHLLTLIMLMIISTTSFAQKDDKVKTIEVQTSIQCGMCEDRILEKFSFEKGIKSVDVDLDTKIVTVKLKKRAAQ